MGGETHPLHTERRYVKKEKEQEETESPQRSAPCCRIGHDLLKYGLSLHHWNEFVVRGYHHYQFDAIFLAGLPDVKDSLPHA